MLCKLKMYSVLLIYCKKIADVTIFITIIIVYIHYTVH